MIQKPSATPHLDQLRADWTELTGYRNGTKKPFIDGESFSIAAVIAVSRFRIVPSLSQTPEVLDRVTASAEFASDFVKNAAAGAVSGSGGADAVNSEANSAFNANNSDAVKPGNIALQPIQAQVQSMYGVTTGFGGSANTRLPPSKAATLQQVLIKGLQAGIIPLDDTGSAATKDEGQDLNTLGNEKLLMPEAWVKEVADPLLLFIINSHPLPIVSGLLPPSLSLSRNPPQLLDPWAQRLQI
ncbi:hypothetical protein BU17DRAFT_89777 [Hysterangium stoloniferum]|nr:hypothetical protein BU17DRAFT_89777 [Hysterangium stoloniferum]